MVNINICVFTSLIEVRIVWGQLLSTSKYDLIMEIAVVWFIQCVHI